MSRPVRDDKRIPAVMSGAEIDNTHRIALKGTVLETTSD